MIWADLSKFDLKPGASVMQLNPDNIALSGDVSDTLATHSRRSTMHRSDRGAAFVLRLPAIAYANKNAPLAQGTEARFNSIDRDD